MSTPRRQAYKAYLASKSGEVEEVPDGRRAYRAYLASNSGKMEEVPDEGEPLTQDPGAAEPAPKPKTPYVPDPDDLLERLKAKFKDEVRPRLEAESSPESEEFSTFQRSPGVAASSVLDTRSFPVYQPINYPRFNPQLLPVDNSQPDSHSKQQDQNVGLVKITSDRGSLGWKHVTVKRDVLERMLLGYCRIVLSFCRCEWSRLPNNAPTAKLSDSTTYSDLKTLERVPCRDFFHTRAHEQCIEDDFVRFTLRSIEQHEGGPIKLPAAAVEFLIRATRTPDDPIAIARGLLHEESQAHEDNIGFDPVELVHDLTLAIGWHAFYYMYACCWIDVDFTDAAEWAKTDKEHYATRLAEFTHVLFPRTYEDVALGL
ncbi:hypothetical protein QBC46DRAFT_346578 [Diplogelasinospora grovesii]|uniref:Uncharacterized protein n=1 Tax=Diplogelasinospora grovesii TaxID=303347 RepID=A0AAN6S0H3_9PEZI|nr:hypothetical protein QBC46DRAFT_346578 [Diplogelasinospora grovesii]